MHAHESIQYEMEEKSSFFAVVYIVIIDSGVIKIFICRPN